jgi:3-deoxy-manno-octulosonate cytidylyltransferase (CMP-KDO synthetase)
MASSRYPGKPLELIMGLPLVEHVRRRSLLAGSNLVVVATCDIDIKEATEKFGGRAVMTRDTHERCTDRIEEAMENLPGDIVVMVQGDEPLLMPEAINAVAAPLLADPTLPIVNLLSPLQSKEDYENPNIVKAVCKLNGDVIFFTRSSIPFFREQIEVPVYRQTGIMAFRKEALNQFSALPATALEKAESVDMLRAIEHGMRIAGVVADYPTIGVDKPSDVLLVESVLATDKVQQELFKSISR